MPDLVNAIANGAGVVMLLILTNSYTKKRKSRSVQEVIKIPIAGVKRIIALKTNYPIIAVPILIMNGRI
ncbi:Uncharacterised protein [Providencia rustigianii]|nr:Uncharacterised protein [Providencia rustigianii]